MTANQQAYDEVYAYTMGRDGFILQHVVDAYGAQTATPVDKPIRVVFALVGLYLHLEKRFSGSAVQRAHMKMGQRKRTWPAIVLPEDRGTITAADVLSAPAGVERDRAIELWCQNVWDAFRDNRDAIIQLVREYEIAS
jgi:hypothetical protein